VDLCFAPTFDLQGLDMIPERVLSQHQWLGALVHLDPRPGPVVRHSEPPKALVGWGVPDSQGAHFWVVAVAAVLQCVYSAFC